MNAQVELFVEDAVPTEPVNALEQLNFIEILVDQYKKQKINLSESIKIISDLDSQSKRLMSVMGCVFEPSQKVEELEHLLKVDFWNTVYQRSNIRDFLDAEKRSEWGYKLHVEKSNNADLPDFTLENVTETVKGWYASRESFFMDRVDFVFRSLSKTHVTNQPEGFSKKLIFSHGCEMSFGTGYNIKWETEEKLFDLECLICILTNRPTPIRSANNSKKNLALGMKHSFLGDSYQLQVFKTGTIHIWIHPSIAIDLNIWLSKKYPSAIPSQLRTKTKTFKEYEYKYDALTADDVSVLESIISGYGVWKATNEPMNRFIKFSGCSFEDINKPAREIDKNITKLARLVLRNGYPNIKDHQFYPTPKSITNELAEYLGSSISTSEMKILEPSAGTGNLAKLFNKEFVTCVEVNSFFVEALKNQGYSDIHNTDFLKFKSKEKFDLIVMNPPYSEKRLDQHLEKALSLLASDGELLLIAPTGKLTSIENIANDYTVNIVKNHTNEFEDTTISTSIFSITAQ